MSQPESWPVALGDELDVVVVASDEVVYEGAEGKNLQPAGAGVVEREADEPRAQTVAFERRVDLGVDERDQVGLRFVFGEAGRAPVDANIVAPLGGVVVHFRLLLD